MGRHVADGNRRFRRTEMAHLAQGGNVDLGNRGYEAGDVVTLTFDANATTEEIILLSASFRYASMIVGSALSDRQ